jgi:hypothetical protein
MKHSSTLGTSFLAQSLGRSKGFLLSLSTTTMVLDASMPINTSFLGHLSLGVLGAGFLSGL